MQASTVLCWVKSTLGVFWLLQPRPSGFPISEQCLVSADCGGVEATFFWDVPSATMRLMAVPATEVWPSKPEP